MAGDKQERSNDAVVERGRRASKGSGEVHGAGAGAGGGGTPEDYSEEAQAGGGRFPKPADRGPHVGGDAPQHGSR